MDSGGGIIEHHSQNEWESLIVNIRDQLLHYAMMKTRNWTQAEDLVSLTIEKCLRARTKFIKGSNFRSWIYTCLHNNWNSSLRAKKRSRVSDKTLDDISNSIVFTAPESSTEIVLANEIIVKIAREIEHRESCFLVWLDGKTYEEAAAIQQITVGTIKSRLWRAKAKLRGILGEDGLGIEPGPISDSIG